MATTSFLLKVTDDTVQIYQSLISILSDFYEANVRDMSDHSGHSLSSPNLEVVQLTCHELSENLATLWPCEEQFVAVFGRTGCGKSTLLNLLLCMMCATAETYDQGIRTDSTRAVLRDTARVHGKIDRATTNRGQGEAGSGPEDTENPESSRETLGSSSSPHGVEGITSDLLMNERLSISGLLGICCAQDRQLYMSKHVPHYDKYPFLLQNGRMGDAGTTKVTAIEYGPKFVGYVRWTSKKKLRKKLRDLRHLLEKQDRSTDEEQSLAELKEFWYCVCQLADIRSDIVRPSEEQISKVIDILGANRLDKEDVIETQTTEGCIIDRIVVREGIKEKLSQELGKLAEDLRIEVPVPSFEGGIGLLDVPGTNDPRFLHQRETRDAIDRTSLILLVLDKSVMDVQTQNSLVESPLLERMLMDATSQCSLVVVGIAEKDNKKGLSPKELVDGFDPKESILKTLRKSFGKIASRLCKSKRIQMTDAFERIDSLFSRSICLLPVLPFLCASLYLTPSNPALHKTYCESKNHRNCPLSMSKEQIREKCMETNIPQLLEKLHSVRVPPKSEELCQCINSIMDRLRLLTEQSALDSSYIKFLKREWEHAKRIVAHQIYLEKYPDSYVDIPFMDAMLDNCAEECRLQPDDIQEIKDSVSEELLSQLQTGRFSMGPFIVRGFRPESIGQTAQKLVQSVDNASQKLMELALTYLKSLLGNAAHIDATLDKIQEEYQPLAVSLYDQLHSRWDLSLRRLRAKCFCGGRDGGLLGKVRVALHQAYFGSLKHVFKRIKQRGSEHYKEILGRILSNNEVGMYAAEAAKTEVKKAVDVFWGNLSELTNREMQFLWKAWQGDIRNLAQSATKAMHAKNEFPENAESRENIDSCDDKQKVLQAALKEKMQKLDSLLKLLTEPMDSTDEVFHYGYSLLQGNPQFWSHINNNVADQVGRQNLQVSIITRDQSGVAVNLQGSVEKAVLPGDYASNDPRMREDVIRQTKDCNLSIDRTILIGQNNSSQENQLESSGSKILQTGDDTLSPRSPNLNRLASFSKPRKAVQVLSEVESHKLQNRAKRFKK